MYVYIYINIYIPYIHMLTYIHMYNMYTDPYVYVYPCTYNVHTHLNVLKYFEFQSTLSAIFKSTDQQKTNTLYL